jgi:polysaccharide deacetylase family protein (PEP-CTERM system associated)
MNVSRATRDGRDMTIITVDVEEWFHGHNYLDHVPPAQWDAQESRVEKGMARCLDLLDRHAARATFFVLGWTAERHPEVVREIARRGHEVACHSYGHPEVFRLTPDEFRRDCLRAREALAAAGAPEPAGYRAPSFSITPPVHGYLHILQECGFGYDCSLFPVRHPRYGQPGSPRRPFRLGAGADDLVVVPMPTWRALGVNVPYSGGGYLRLLPWPAFRYIRARAAAQGVPCIVYLHPWELDDYRPDAGQPALLRWRSQSGQESMPLKLERVLAGSACEALGAHVQRLRRDGDLPVRSIAAPAAAGV